MDPLIEAFKALLDAKGGPRAVAKTIKMGWENLDQIYKGVPLPSGNPRGVGRKVRAALDKHYPGWIEASKPASDTASVSEPLPPYVLWPAKPTLAQAVAVVAEAIMPADKDTRALIASLLPNLATNPENHVKIAAGLQAMLNNGPTKPANEQLGGDGSIVA